jgi:Ca2+-binding RTX toxin-like protein
VVGGGNDRIYAHCALPVSSTTSGTTAEGRDLIIVGSGADTVYGWPSDYTLGGNSGDLFIAGTTNLSYSAIDTVLAEWDSSDS